MTNRALHDAAMQMQRTAAAILHYLDKPEDERRLFTMQVEWTKLEEALIGEVDGFHAEGTCR